MRNRNTLFAALLFWGIIAAAAFFAAFSDGTLPTGKKVSAVYTAAELSKKFPVTAEEMKKERQSIKDAMEYIQRMRASDPTTLYLDPKLVTQTRQRIADLRAQRSSGPLGLNWNFMGPDNVGGRTRAILVDQNNSQLVYAAGVTGGLFVSQDGGLEWSPNASNAITGDHCITSIIQTANGDIYYGTGEFASLFTVNTESPVGFTGNGVYKSTDGGVTFNQLPATGTAQPDDNANQTWSFVNMLAYRPGSSGDIILAATHRGLQYSADSGNTWASVNGLGSDTSTPCTDVKVASNGMVHAVFASEDELSAYDEYYQSSDGINFTKDPGGTFPTNAVSGSLAVSPQDPNYVYVSLVNTAEGLFAIYNSTDGGNTWSTFSPVNSSEFNPLGFQGIYDNIITVDPANKVRVFIGGQVSMYAGGDSLGWTEVSYGYLDNTNPYYIHPDFHSMAFDPQNPNTLYIGTDGGIAKSLNAGTTQPSFTTRNKSYDVTQFYYMDAALTGEVIGGSQDNGTSYINTLGNTIYSANLVSGGDGAFSYISKTNPDAFFVTADESLSRSSDGGVTFGSFYDSYITALSLNFQFFASIALWETNDTGVNGTYVFPDVFMEGYVGGVIFTLQALDFSTTPAWYDVPLGNATYSAITKTNDCRFYAGSTNGVIYLISGFQDTATTHYVNGANANAVTGLTLTEVCSNGRNSPFYNRYITSIAVDPHDPAHIVVTTGGYGFTSNVFESHNGTSANATFISIQGNPQSGGLPQMPVYSAVISTYDSTALIVGTDNGVWATANTGYDTINPNNWGEEDAGLSSVPVYWLEQQALYDTTCQLLYAASYGSGMYRDYTLTNRAETGCNTNIGEGIANTNAGTMPMTVYPNPASDKTILEMELAQPVNVNIRVIDMLGRVYMNKSYGQLNGKQQIQLDVSGLAPGNYLVSAQTGESYTTKPLVVVR